jgi:hypothetical protein
MLADLPTLTEYHALSLDPLLLARFDVDMHDLFYNYKSLQQKGIDELTESKLSMFLPLRK